MMDLRTVARGIEFDCLGLAECCAEFESARCPCARRVVDGPPPGRMRVAASVSRDTPHPRISNPPAPTLGDLLAEAFRRRA